MKALKLQANVHVIFEIKPWHSGDLLWRASLSGEVMVWIFNICIQFNYHFTIWCNQQCSYMNRNKYSSVMIAQLMSMSLSLCGWVWLLDWLVGSFTVRLLWTWYWTLGFENVRDFLTDWVTVSVPRRTIPLWPVGAAERNQDIIDWQSAVLEANKADQERLEMINSKTSSLVGLTWCFFYHGTYRWVCWTLFFFTHTHIYMYVCVCVCIYICMCVCVCVYIYIYIYPDKRNSDIHKIWHSCSTSAEDSSFLESYTMSSRKFVLTFWTCFSL